MKQIALHHTADPSLSVQLWKVNRYHKSKWGMQSKRGWYVGYNYFVERDGRRIHTRNLDEETVANRGHNCDVPERCDTISYCMAGDFRTQTPSEAQTADITAFINEMTKLYPDIYVVGHRDLGQTTCPGVPQSYIDNLNKEHTNDQKEKAEALAELQSKIDIIRAMIAKIMAMLK